MPSPTKIESETSKATEEGHGHFWQPLEGRDHLSDAARRWLEENADAIKGWNDYVEKNGLPLAKYRKF